MAKKDNNNPLPNNPPQAIPPQAILPEEKNENPGSLNLPVVPTVGDVREPIENDPENAAAPGEQPPKRKRGRPPGSGSKKKAGATAAAPAEKPELDKDMIENALFLTDLCVFTPTNIIWGFEPPKKEMQNRIAKLECKLFQKYFDTQIADEYMLAGLVAIWIMTNLVKVFLIGKKDKKGEQPNEQRNNVDIRTQADGKNPFDAPAFETGK
jgi:hypothetical protein